MFGLLARLSIEADLLTLSGEMPLGGWFSMGWLPAMVANCCEKAVLCSFDGEDFIRLEWTVPVPD